MGTKTITEYVLSRVEGDARQPLFSDEELDVVHHHRLDEIRSALANGKKRPELVITQRVCTHPLNKDGNPIAGGAGSTCEETDIHP